MVILSVDGHYRIENVRVLRVVQRPTKASAARSWKRRVQNVSHPAGRQFGFRLRGLRLQVHASESLKPISFARMRREMPPADAMARPFGLNGLMKRIAIVPLALIAAISVVSLAGCASIKDQLQNESSVEFATATEVATEWDKTAPWLPEDATDIQIRQSAEGDPAVLLSTSDAALDPSLCVETERKSAPTFTEDWSPDSYVDTIFACGDWAVIPTDTGWYGWTPNHPDEKAASLQVSPE
jgi:hypothetical protein